MLSFHLYINGILIIVPIDNCCHPRWGRSILGICRSKGLNMFSGFLTHKIFFNSFFGLGLFDKGTSLETSKSFLSSNSSLELGEACSVAADCGDPQVLWILLWRCKIRLLMILNDTQALIFSMLRYLDYNCDNTNLFSSGVLLRAQACSFCRILSLDRAL